VGRGAGTLHSVDGDFDRISITPLHGNIPIHFYLLFMRLYSGIVSIAVLILSWNDVSLVIYHFRCPSRRRHICQVYSTLFDYVRLPGVRGRVFCPVAITPLPYSQNNITIYSLVRNQGVIQYLSLNPIRLKLMRQNVVDILPTDLAETHYSISAIALTLQILVGVCMSAIPCPANKGIQGIQLSSAFHPFGPKFTSRSSYEN